MNRLAQEASPYLRDHASNPVDWYPWAEEAWRRARDENKPILLSIGYSACHWCHVMARESFEDETLARFLNDNFVCIKVDREERPDVDDIFIEAVRLLNSSAGWPLNVFLTPELKPFFGGTYFPPEPRHGLPAFRQVLAAVMHHFRTERGEVDMAANTIVAELSRLSDERPPAPGLVDEPLRRFLADRRATFDSRNGGFGGAPKFPMPTDLILLLRLARRPGFGDALRMATLTLERMARGGIHDQLAGGFHRYSTDSVWLVPHFEKMLYDNALLAQAYLAAFSLIRDEEFGRVAGATLDFLLAELRGPDGGFFSAIDADTAQGEGHCYSWTPAEVEATLGRELGAQANRYFGVTEPGNFHGRSIPHVAGQEPPESLDRIKAGLLAARNRRDRPRTDDKVLADWNGLALSALAQGYTVLGDARFLDAARSLARFLERRLLDGDDLLHLVRPGQQPVPGLLADYAFTCQGFLDLYAAGFQAGHLDRAVRLADRMLSLFYTAGRGFFQTRDGTPGLFTRPMSGYDGAIPSGASAAVSCLLRLERLTGRQSYRADAEETLRLMSGSLREHPQAHGAMLTALDYALNPGSELVLAAADPAQARSALAPFPDPYRTVVAFGGDSADPETARLCPLAAGRYALDGVATAYLCSNGTCHKSVQIAELEHLLSSLPECLDTRRGQTRL